MTDTPLFSIAGGRPHLEAVVAVFDPARLTQARQAVPWTKKRLADELGVSPAAIGQYEAGVIRPRPEQLQRIAELLGVPAEFFAVGRPKAVVDASTTHFRSLRSMRAYERDQAMTYVAQLWELCHALERRVRLPAVDLIDAQDFSLCEPSSAAAPPNAAAAAAGALRARWGLGSEPVSHLVRTLEMHGILVGLLPFSDARRVDAFSTSHTPRPIVVLASDNPDVYRHRFTAAHELGHLVLHGEAQPGDVRHEREANAFAAEFLMPASRLKSAIPRRVDFARLVALQRQWGVSVEALLYRGRELGDITDATHRRARIKLNDLRNQGVVRNEVVKDFPGELPQLLARAATACGEPLTELAAELAWPTERVRALLRQPADRPQLRLVGPE